MLDELKKEANLTYTENGALAYRSTYSSCLDLFATCGAMRQADSNTIIRKFTLAFTESPDIAIRILFYARDIRGGLGERRFFNIILHHLANTAPQSVKKNLPLIGEYGRYDDILSLLGTKCEKAMAGFISRQLKKDIYAMEKGNSVSLLAKWLPSVNSSVYETSERAKKLCRLLGMREKEYRKTLSILRAYIGIVEDKMRRKDYTFNYENLPGRALFKYRCAMYRHDKKRYKLYIKRFTKTRLK